MPNLLPPTFHPPPGASLHFTSRRTVHLRLSNRAVSDVARVPSAASSPERRLEVPVDDHRIEGVPRCPSVTLTRETDTHPATGPANTRPRQGAPGKVVH